MTVDTSVATNSGSATNKADAMQRVEVTGSLIRSADKTEYNQIQMVTAADIKNSGAASVADFLRQISANSGSSYNESTVLNQSINHLAVLVLRCVV